MIVLTKSPNQLLFFSTDLLNPEIVDLDRVPQCLALSEDQARITSYNVCYTKLLRYQHNGQEITDSFSTLINPEIDIPFFITELTGIDNRMVKDAPRFYEVAKKIVEMTQGRTFIAHNA